MSAAGESLTLSVAETAAALGVSTQLVYDMAGRGELRVIRMGRRVVVPRIVLDELLSGRAS